MRMMLIFLDLKGVKGTVVGSIEIHKAIPGARVRTRSLIDINQGE